MFVSCLVVLSFPSVVASMLSVVFVPNVKDTHTGEKKNATVKSKEKVCDSLKLLHPLPDGTLSLCVVFLVACEMRVLHPVLSGSREVCAPLMCLLSCRCVCVGTDGCWTVVASCRTRLSMVVHSEVCPLSLLCIFFACFM